MGDTKNDFIVLQSKVIWYLVAYHEQIIIKADELEKRGQSAGSKRLKLKADAVSKIVIEFQSLSNFDK